MLACRSMCVGSVARSRFLGAARSNMVSMPARSASSVGWRIPKQNFTWSFNSSRPVRRAYLFQNKNGYTPLSLSQFYSSKALPTHSRVLLPKLSPTMTTGNILEWKKQEGEFVDEGSVLALVETDKAEMEMETPEAGYLAKILVGDGSSDIPLMTLIGIMVEEEGDIEAFKDFTEDAAGVDDSAATAGSTAPAPEAAPVPSSPVASPAQSSVTVPTSSEGRIFASPLAKQLAASKGIKLESVSGSGPGGRIVASDVEGAPVAAPAPSAPAAAPIAMQSTGAYTDLTLSGMRKTIAKRLMESKQTIPHYYLSVDVNMDQIVALRKELNSAAGDRFKLSVNDFIVKASSLALKRVPECNSSWMGDFIRQYNNVDISIAVSTDGGLITPIVFNADQKGLVSINNNVKELAEKARNKQLQPHEFQGGTFSISNLGMYGVKNFSAVINPPQSCILAVGGTENTLIPDASDERGFRSAAIMSVTLSCDHRVVDGAVGAMWLKHFKSYLENPTTMLL